MMTTRAQMSEAAKYAGGHTDLVHTALAGQTVKSLLEGN